MQAHGTIVRDGLLVQYASDSKRKTLSNVFCVANRLYGKSIKVDPQNSDEFEAMNIDIRSTGIPELRRYCHELPAKRQLDAAKHFLTVSIGGLLNKVHLWLADGAEDLGADKAKESLERLSKRFQDVSEKPSGILSGSNCSYRNQLLALNSSRAP